MTRRLALLLLTLTGLDTLTPVHAIDSNDFQSGKIAAKSGESGDLPYRFALPENYDSSVRYPLIVFLHGAGEVGTDNQAPLSNNANGALQLAQRGHQHRFPAVFLIPQSPRGWSPQSVDQMVRAIEELKQRFSIDPDRILLTGLSNGGFATVAAVGNYPQVFAAMAPMSAGPAGDIMRCLLTPTWVFHAENDRTVPISNGDVLVGNLWNFGNPAIFTRYATGDHQIWPTAYADPSLLPWLMAQRRGYAAPASAGPQITVPSLTTAPFPIERQQVTQFQGSVTLNNPVALVDWISSPFASTGTSGSASYTTQGNTANFSITNPKLDAEDTRLIVRSYAEIPEAALATSPGGGATLISRTLLFPVFTNTATPPSLSLAAGLDGTTTTQESVDAKGTFTFDSSLSTAYGCSVIWSLADGRTGTALVNPSLEWNAQGIPLSLGANTIQLTLVTPSNQTQRLSFTVTRTAPADVTAPSISRHPTSQTAAQGDMIILRARATGTGPFTYRWYKDGLLLPSHYTPSLLLSDLQPSDAGSYTAVATNAAGTATSAPAQVSVSAQGQLQRGRLSNLSVRGLAGSDSEALFVGAITTGTGQIPLLLRGWGPSLRVPPFNLESALSDPDLFAYQGSTLLFENDNWGGTTMLKDAFSRAGAFVFADPSKDAALAGSFASGTINAKITSRMAPRGATLAEVFDLSPEATPPVRLVNLSARAPVGTGGDVLIGGFVVSQAGPVTVLVRAVGPKLSDFNVPGVLANPTLELYSGQDLLVANDDWSDALNAKKIREGGTGFALPEGSKDSCLLVTLPPGSYTAIVRGKQEGTGVALLEVYDVR